LELLSRTLLFPADPGAHPGLINGPVLAKGIFCQGLLKKTPENFFLNHACLGAGCIAPACLFVAGEKMGYFPLMGFYIGA
jgi:hypothetical protein